MYGGPDFLVALYESLVKFDQGIEWHWWVIDDKGPQTPKLYDIYSRIRRDERCTIIPPIVNRGFAGANNYAVARGSAKYILLLNSDTRVRHDGWLKEMTDELVDMRIGVVGARLVFFKESKDPNKPSGRTQHAGVAFNLLGQPYHIFMGWSIDHPKVDQRRKMNAVTGACLLTRRDIYTKLGGLDTDYTTGNFEDVQYCLQVRRDGLFVVYTPAATLDHFAGGSDNTATRIKNERLFHVKAGHLAGYDEWRYYAVDGPIEE